MNDSDNNNKIEIYHRANKLKLKAGAGLHDGPGYIDPHAVNRAQTVMDKREVQYKNEVEEVLKNLNVAWEKMQSPDRDTAENGANELYHYANHVKDLATTFHYGLMGHFGTSLREFAEKIDTKNEAHMTIVQAHIDVMWAACTHNLKDEDGEMASELKNVVAKAIEKYF